MILLIEVVGDNPHITMRPVKTFDLQGRGCFAHRLREVVGECSGVARAIGDENDSRLGRASVTSGLCSLMVKDRALWHSGPTGWGQAARQQRQQTNRNDVSQCTSQEKLRKRVRSLW